MVDGLKAGEFALGDGSGFCGHQIPKHIGRIVAADAIFVRVHLQDVLRTVWIVLERGQGLD
jgi:hypothetical protein